MRSTRPRPSPAAFSVLASGVLGWVLSSFLSPSRADAGEPRQAYFAGPVSEPLASDDDAHWWDGFGTRDQAGLNGEVWALTVYQGKLVAGGFLTRAGGIPARRIAMWDGRSWSAFRGGIDDWDCPEIKCLGHVKALAVWDSSLVVAGSFPSVDGGLIANHIARWDGARWRPLGLGMNAPVWALTVYNGDLIAAGEFTQAGGRIVNYIARWNGQQWYPLGAGLNGGVGLGDLIVYGDDLVASGPFTTAGEVDVNHIARWDGNSWWPLGSGVSNSSCLCLFEGDLLAGGVFSAGSLEIHGMARWDGSSWSRFGTPNFVIPADCVCYEGKLVIAGQFTSIGNRIARWSGSAWEPMGSGLDEMVLALAVQESSLYAGGRFLTAGSKPSEDIARWDDVITPVLVQDLLVSPWDDGLRVAWRLAYEAADGLTGVHVQRADYSSGPFINLTQAPLVPGAEMAFEDHEVDPERANWYRLLLLHQNGIESFVGPVLAFAERFSPPGQSLRVVSVPGSGTPIEIRYTIGYPSRAVRIGIHDVLGRDLLSLDLGAHGPGTYLVTWDTRDHFGRSVPSGVYFVSLQASQSRWVKKIALVR